MRSIPFPYHFWSIGHNFEHEFFCLGRLGSQVIKGKEVDLRFSEQLLRVIFQHFIVKKMFKIILKLLHCTKKSHNIKVRNN